MAFLRGHNVSYIIFWTYFRGSRCVRTNTRLYDIAEPSRLRRIISRAGPSGFPASLTKACFTYISTDCAQPFYEGLKRMMIIYIYIYIYLYSTKGSVNVNILIHDPIQQTRTTIYINKLSVKQLQTRHSSALFISSILTDRAWHWDIINASCVSRYIYTCTRQAL